MEDKFKDEVLELIKANGFHKVMGFYRKETNLFISYAKGVNFHLLYDMDGERLEVVVRLVRFMGEFDPKILAEVLSKFKPLLSRFPNTTYGAVIVVRIKDMRELERFMKTINTDIPRLVRVLNTTYNRKKGRM